MESTSWPPAFLTRFRSNLLGQNVSSAGAVTPHADDDVVKSDSQFLFSGWLTRESNASSASISNSCFVRITDTSLELYESEQETGGRPSECILLQDITGVHILFDHPSCAFSISTVVQEILLVAETVVETKRWVEIIMSIILLNHGRDKSYESIDRSYWDAEFVVAEQAERYRCNICHRIPKVVVSPGKSVIVDGCSLVVTDQSCSHVFCISCLEAKLPWELKCPICFRICTAAWVIVPSHVGMSQVRCPFAGFGCRQLIPASQLTEHSNSCNYAPPKPQDVQERERKEILLEPKQQPPSLASSGVVVLGDVISQGTFLTFSESPPPLPRQQKATTPTVNSSNEKVLIDATSVLLGGLVLSEDGIYRFSNGTESNSGLLLSPDSRPLRKADYTPNTAATMIMTPTIITAENTSLNNAVPLSSSSSSMSTSASTSYSSCSCPYSMLATVAGISNTTCHKPFPNNDLLQAHLYDGLIFHTDLLRDSLQGIQRKFSTQQQTIDQLQQTMSVLLQIVNPMDEKGRRSLAELRRDYAGPTVVIEDNNQARTYNSGNGGSGSGSGSPPGRRATITTISANNNNNAFKSTATQPKITEESYVSPQQQQSTTSYASTTSLRPSSDNPASKYRLNKK